MNNSTSPSPVAYSPFWAIVLIAVGLLGLELSNVVESARQQGRLKAMLAESGNGFSRAQTILQTTEKVGRDLLALTAAGSTEAGKIVSEFKMQINSGAPAPAK